MNAFSSFPFMETTFQIFSKNPMMPKTRKPLQTQENKLLRENNVSFNP